MVLVWPGLGWPWTWRGDGILGGPGFFAHRPRHSAKFVSLCRCRFFALLCPFVDLPARSRRVCSSSLRSTGTRTLSGSCFGPSTPISFPALQSSPRLRQAGRSDPLAVTGASRRKQIPCSPPQGHCLGKTWKKRSAEYQFHKSQRKELKDHKREWLLCVLCVLCGSTSLFGVAQAAASSVFSTRCHPCTCVAWSCQNRVALLNSLHDRPEKSKLHHHRRLPRGRGDQRCKA
jgi:hypothetical protein